MRTTVTLDPDVERRLRTVVRVNKLSFKEALNESVRRWVDSLLPKSKSKFFHTSPEDMGSYPHLDYDNIGELLDATEKLHPNASR